MSIQSNISADKVKDSNVVPSNGKLSFQIPLFQVNSPNTLSFNLNLLYNSNLLRAQYETWAEESNSGILATGWALSSRMRIVQLSIEPSLLWLQYNDDVYPIREKETEESYILYETEIHSNLNIKYYSELDYWVVTGIDGNLYYFGKDDTYTDEEGEYSPQTGGYSHESGIYTSARQLITTSSNHAADNSICSSKEKTVVWDNDWVGPSNNVSKQRQKTTGWYLSHVEDTFGNIFAISYIQHISNVCETAGSLTYTIATYPYRMRLFVRDSETETISFTYAEKDTAEYAIDLLLYERPNGMQQRFEKLRIDSLSHYFGGNKSDIVKFNTFLTIPTEGNNKLAKRQLTGIEFLHGQYATVQYKPGYVFEYYGENDGVGVSPAGFDETHRYCNAENGALYGHLKSITYPSGAKKIYEYAELPISNIGLSTDITLQESEEEPTVIHTPFDYSIIIRKNESETTIEICTWTSKGWVHQELMSAASTVEYDYQKYLSYSYYLIGFIDPSLQHVYVYSRNINGEGVWGNSPFESVLNSNYVYGPGEKKAITVNDTGVAMSALLENQQESDIGYLWFFSTEDNGRTFVQKQYQSLQPLVGTISNYHVSLKITENRCYVFALIKGMDLIRPDNWNPSSWLPQYPDIEHISLNIGILDTIIPGMETVQLGKVPFIIHRYAWNDSSAWYKGLVCLGGKVAKVLQVEQSAQMFSIKFYTNLQWAKYWFSNWQLEQGDSESLLWSVDLLLCNGGRSFKYLVPNGNIEERMISEEPISLNNMQSVTFSSCTSGAGSIYQYYYNYRDDITTIHETFGTVFANYNGDSVIVQTDNSTKNLACLMKDDIFAVFETAESSGETSRKTYRYFDQRLGRWEPINTGTLSQQSTSYNRNASVALKVVEYLGMVLFIALLPLGLGSTAGIMLTFLSVAMMASSYTAQAIFNNSIKTTLNPACSFMGNRFLNDGTTIWHRNSNQNLLTAIGAGTAAQPYDVLSDASIVGQIYTAKQQYGVVYDYVPFQTTQNRIYYRRLKNGAVGAPCAIGGISEGCDDLYADGMHLYAYAGKYKYVFNGNSKFESKCLISDEHPFFSNVDACAYLNNNIGGSGYKLITISGTKCCMNYAGVTTPPEEIAEVFRGSNFTFVDAALELNGTQFYLFSGNQYELVEMRNNGFQVIGTGTLDEYSSGLELDKIDAACVWNTEKFYFRNNSFVKISSSGAQIESGKLGSDRFYEEFNKDSAKIQFMNALLSVYESGACLKLYKQIDGHLCGVYRDYVVSKVYISSSPNDRHVIEYGYDTNNAAFAESIGSGLYQRIFVGIN